MYCKNCGCKIPVGAAKCPDCGEENGDIEYCGGFWGITELAAKVGKEASSVETNNDHSMTAADFPEMLKQPGTNEYSGNQGNIEGAGNAVSMTIGADRKPEKKKNNLLLKLLSAVAVIILVFGLAQTIRLSMLKKQYTRYQQKSQTDYSSLEQDYTSLQQQMESLNNEYTSLKGQYNDQNEQYENLSQEYETLKSTNSEENVVDKKTNALFSMLNTFSQRQSLQEKAEESASETQEDSREQSVSGQPTGNTGSPSGRGPAGNGR